MRLLHTLHELRGRPMLRRLMILAMLVMMSVFWLALPAFAQSDAVPIEASPVTAIALLTAAVKLAVDKIRKYTPLDGDLVNLTALGLAYLATYVPEVLVDPPDSWVDRITVAIGVAGLSAVFAQFAPSHEVEEKPSGV